MNEGELELEFEQQAFVELLSEDGLIILARWSSVFCNLQSPKVFLLQRVGPRQTLPQIPQVVL